MKKVYVVDTNVLLEDEFAIKTLRNGEENEVVIPYSVMNELDGLKKDLKKRELVLKALDQLESEFLNITVCKEPKNVNKTGDESIISDILTIINKQPILISNDRLFRLKAKFAGINTQEYLSANPFKTESEEYTGIIKDDEEPIHNCFSFIDGIPSIYKDSHWKPISYQHTVWKVSPKNEYQNMAFELLLDDDLSIVSLQSKSGFGKTYLALAAALYLVLEKKKYSKIYIVKSPVEIGPRMGYLPGDAAEKLESYFRPVIDLVFKLNRIRECKRVIRSEQARELDPEYIEMLPLAFVRGMNIENAILIVDEMQNLSRTESRALLTRLGENTKAFCIGDTNQVDNHHLNEFNNGLNWLVKLCKGQKEYGHLVLKGSKSRGPVTDLILRIGL